MAACTIFSESEQNLITTFLKILLHQHIKLPWPRKELAPGACNDSHFHSLHTHSTDLLFTNPSTTLRPFLSQSLCSGCSRALEGSSLCSEQWPLSPHSGLVGNVTLFQRAMSLLTLVCTPAHPSIYLSNPTPYTIFFVPPITIGIFLFVSISSPLEHKLDESRSAVLFTAGAPLVEDLVDHRWPKCFCAMNENANFSRWHEEATQGGPPTLSPPPTFFIMAQKL